MIKLSSKWLSKLKLIKEEKNRIEKEREIISTDVYQ